LILVEDLECKEYEASLQNWIKNETYREYLNSYQKEAMKQSYESMLEELTTFINSGFEEILRSLSRKLILLKRSLIEQTKGVLRDQIFEDHLSIENLMKILRKKNENNSLEISQLLSSFFNYDLNNFFKNKKDVSLEDLKGKIEKYITKIDQAYDSIKISPINYFPNEVYEITRFSSSGGVWGYAQKTCDCVTFNVDQNVLLDGVSIFALQNNPTEGFLKVLEGENADEEKALYEMNFRFINEEKAKSVVIKLENPLKIERNKKYTLFLMMNEGVSVHGKKGSSLVKVKRKEDDDGNEINLQFFNTSFGSLKSNGTHISEGQFEKMLFSLE